MMFCFAVGEWWMTLGPCTSEIKAVNIFMNVCGSPDLLPHFISWGWLCICVSACVVSHTLSIGKPLEISGPDSCLVQGSLQNPLCLLRTSQVSVNGGSWAPGQGVPGLNNSVMVGTCSCVMDRAFVLLWFISNRVGNLACPVLAGIYPISVSKGFIQFV